MSSFDHLHNIHLIIIALVFVQETHSPCTDAGARLSTSTCRTLLRTVLFCVFLPSSSFILYCNTSSTDGNYWAVYLSSTSGKFQYGEYGSFNSTTNLFYVFFTFPQWIEPGLYDITSVTLYPCTWNRD